MQFIRLENPYTLEKTLAQLRFILSVKGGHYLDSLELLEKAVAKSLEDEAYAKQLEATLLQGSTLELRELLSPFGDYFAPPRSEFPFYPHTDAVNGLDTAMHHLKCGANGININ